MLVTFAMIGILKKYLNEEIIPLQKALTNSIPNHGAQQSNFFSAQIVGQENRSLFSAEIL